MMIEFSWSGLGPRQHLLAPENLKRCQSFMRVLGVTPFQHLLQEGKSQPGIHGKLLKTYM